MADGHLLTTDEAAWVFRRAAELEALAPDRPEALLDQQTLEAAGVEAGISPVSIRAALEELRAGALAEADPDPDPGGPLSRHAIVRTRAVLGPTWEVARELDTLARRNLLVVSRRRGTTTVWERRHGLVAACMRARPHALRGVTRLTATLGPVPGAPDVVRVELRADLVPVRRLLPLRTRLRVGAGLGLGAGTVAVALGTGAPVPVDVLLLAGGAGGAAWAGSSGLRAARAARDRLGNALAFVLDRIELRRLPEIIRV